MADNLPEGLTLDEPTGLPEGLTLDQPEAKQPGHFTPMPTAPLGPLGWVGEKLLSMSHAGEILSAFGQGAKEGWGTEPLGLSPESDKALRQAGVFNDYADGHTNLLKSFNEAIIRPAAVAAETATRGANAAYHAAGDALIAAGVPRDIVAMPEAFMGSPGAIPHSPVITERQFYAKARSLGVIGGDESLWKGFVGPNGVGVATDAQPVAAMPLTTERAFALTSEEARLRKLDGELAARQEELSSGAPEADAAKGQKALETLGRLQVIEKQLAEATTAEDRAALSKRRDELLTNTTPEQLQAEAAPVAQRRLVGNQRDYIASRLEEIEAERTGALADTALSPLPKVAEAEAATEAGAAAEPVATAAQAASPVAQTAEAAAVGSQTPAKEAETVAAASKPAETKAPEQPAPTTPHQPIPPSETNVVDKAGNVRLDNLNKPDDVKEVMRQTAKDNGDFMEARRGKLSEAETLDMADALGMTPDQLSRRRLGQAFNAEQIKAAQKLLIDSATAVRDAMAKAATGSEDDVLAYAEARARHQMIQEQYSGITAEGGRALNALKKTDELTAAETVSQIIARSTGKTVEELRAEAKLGAELDTPQKVSKFVNDSRKPTFGNMIVEYYTNNLISGPATHGTYTVGNALLALWKALPDTAVAAGIGAMRDLVSRASGNGPVMNRVFAREVAAQLYGILKGSRNGIVAAYKSAKSGIPEALPGETQTAANETGFGRTQGAIPGLVGEGVRLPSRGVTVIHSGFRALGYSQELATQATRTALSEGLTGNALAARINELTTNPPPEMMEAARDAATTQSLMAKPEWGSLSQKIESLFNHNALLKIVNPFVRIGTNVVKQGFVEHTPLGFLSKDVRANIAGENGAVVRDQQIARMTAGTALGAAAIGLAAEGYGTGAGPHDPKEQAVWRLSDGRMPYSVRVGEMWYSTHRLGALGQIIGMAGDLHDVKDAISEGDASKVAWAMVHSVVGGVLDETWMKGPSDLMQAIESPETHGATYVKNMLTAFAPYSVGMAQVTRAVDPYQREAHTVLDAFRAKNVWLSQDLLPKIDIWGQPVPNLSAVGPDGLSAIYQSRVTHDPVNQELFRLGIFPGKPADKIRGIPLTPEQYNDYQRYSGRMAKAQLDQMVNSDWYGNLPDFSKREIITNAVTTSRNAAQAVIMMQPGANIVERAVQDKVNAIEGSGRAAKVVHPPQP